MLLCVLQEEFYTLQYATSLATSPSLWALAAQYMAWCPMHGQEAMRTLLLRVPLCSAGVPDEQLAMRVLHFCRLYRFPGAPRLP